MLYEIMRECRNDFRVAEITGTFEIAGGCIDLPNLLPGQYFLIEGSVMNDGLHQSSDVLTDEAFRGSVALLAVPKAFQDLAERISEWAEKNAPSAFSSESFAGYSYTRATNGNGRQATWKDAFRSDLEIWRKL